jgi:hypothetical protein
MQLAEFRTLVIAESPTTSMRVGTQTPGRGGPAARRSRTQLAALTSLVSAAVLVTTLALGAQPARAATCPVPLLLKAFESIPILVEYSRAGGPEKLGCPSSDVQELAPVEGETPVFQRFDNGAIYDKGNVGAHAVMEPILAFLTRNGLDPESSIGFPISDQQTVPNSPTNPGSTPPHDVFSDFENGVLEYNQATRKVTVEKPYALATNAIEGLLKQKIVSVLKEKGEIIGTPEVSFTIPENVPNGLRTPLGDSTPTDYSYDGTNTHNRRYAAFAPFTSNSSVGKVPGEIVLYLELAYEPSSGTLSAHYTGECHAHLSFGQRAAIFFLRTIPHALLFFVGGFSETIFGGMPCVGANTGVNGSLSLPAGNELKEVLVSNELKKLPQGTEKSELEKLNLPEGSRVPLSTMSVKTMGDGSVDIFTGVPPLDVAIGSPSNGANVHFGESVPLEEGQLLKVAVPFGEREIELTVHSRQVEEEVDKKTNALLAAGLEGALELPETAEKPVTAPPEVTCCSDVWTSDEGALGESATTMSPPLSYAFTNIGEHSVSLMAVNSAGLSGCVGPRTPGPYKAPPSGVDLLPTEAEQPCNAVSQVNVGNGPPTVTIEAPMAGESVYAGLPAQLRGRASDPRAPFGGLPCTWESSNPADTAFPVSGCDVTVTFATPGPRTLTLRSTGSFGEPGQATITVNVIEPTRGGNPLVAFAQPLPGLIVDSATTTVPLEAEAIDPSGSPIEEWRWTVARDQTGAVARTIGTGQSISWHPENCNEGAVKVTVEVTDALGNKGSASAKTFIECPAR